MPTLTTGQPGDVQIDVVPVQTFDYPDPGDDPSLAKSFSSDVQASGQFHTSYLITTSYRTRTGLYLAPTAGPFASGTSTLSTNPPPPPSAAFLAQQPPADFGGGPENALPNYYGFAPAQEVRLHQPYTRKTVTWTAERFGAPPVLPHWDAQVSSGGYPVTNPDGSPRTNANEFCTYRRVSPLAARPTADGQQFLFRVSGVYKYGLRYPVEDGDAVWCGAMPITNVPPELLVINGMAFDRSILRSLPPQSATVPGAVLVARLPEG